MTPAGEVAARLTEASALSARQEATIAQLRREVSEARALRGEFLDAITHELRTPLNAILGFGQVLEMTPLAPEQHDSLRQVLRGGRHLLRVVDDLLELSQLDAGRVELTIEPVAAGDLVAEAIDIVQPLAVARGVAIESPAPSAADPVWMLADRERLKQVLVKLLTNAVVYNGPAGRVAVQVIVTGQLVRCAISDTGRGVTAAEMHRLFSPFDRLDARERGIDGVGLGLALALRLVLAMAGRIDVQSVPGEGSTFSVCLPLAAPLHSREVARQLAGVETRLRAGADAT